MVHFEKSENSVSLESEEMKEKEIEELREAIRKTEDADEHEKLKRRIDELNPREIL